MCMRMSCVNGCVVALDWYLPRTFDIDVNNKHLIVASCWLFLSSYFARDVRSQEPKARMNVFYKNFHF